MKVDQKQRMWSMVEESHEASSGELRTATSVGGKCCHVTLPAIWEQVFMHFAEHTDVGPLCIRLNGAFVGLVEINQGQRAVGPTENVAPLNISVKDTSSLKVPIQVKHTISAVLSASQYTVSFVLDSL